jgi:hypothetical protein
MTAAQYAGSGKDAYGNKVTAGDVALSAGLDVAGGAIAKGLSGAARGVARLARPAAQAVAGAVKGAAPAARSGIANAAKTVGRQAVQSRVGQKLAGMASDITKRSGLADKAKNLRDAARQRVSQANQNMRSYRGLAQRDLSNMQGGVTKAVNRQGPAAARTAKNARQQTIMGTENANRLALKNQAKVQQQVAARVAARNSPLAKGAGPAGRGASSQAARSAAQRKQQQMIMGTETANRTALKNQAQRQVTAKVAARDAARNAPLTRGAGPAGRGASSQATRAAAQRRNNAIVSKQTNQRNAMSRVQPKPVAGKTSGMPPAARPDLVAGQAAQVAKTAAAVTAGRAAVSSVVQPNAQSTASQTSGQPDSARPDKPMGQFQEPSTAAAPKPAAKPTAPAKQQVQKVVQQKTSNTPMSVSAYAKQRASYTGKNLQGQPSVQAGRIATAKAALNTTGGGAKGNLMRQRAQRDLYGPDR